MYVYLCTLRSVCVKEARAKSSDKKAFSYQFGRQQKIERSLKAAKNK